MTTKTFNNVSHIGNVGNALKPDELAEGFVVGQSPIVFLGEDMIDVLHTPGIQKLRGTFWLLKISSENTSFRTERFNLYLLCHAVNLASI